MKKDSFFNKKVGFVLLIELVFFVILGAFLFYMQVTF